MTYRPALLRSVVLPNLWRYIISLALTGVLTILLAQLRESINLYIIVLLYLLPVGLSTLLWGLGAGIVSAVSAFLFYNFFFIQPHFSFQVKHGQDFIGLLVFLAVAVVISQLLGRAQRNLSEANQREREAIRLFEFSMELAGLRDRDGLATDLQIAQAIARHCQETFRANRVEITLESKSGQKPTLIQVPAENLPHSSKKPKGGRPDLLIPLETTRSFLGEIRIWRNGRSLAPAEERLARTLANQGMLSLERARLIQTETRSRVLEESDQLKSALLSSVSHELRTPLATIKAAVTSLRSGTVEWDLTARQELLTAIEEETDHLNQLVGNLLNMSRIEAGALKPMLEWNNIDEIISGVISNMRRVDHQNHTFQLNLPDDLPLVRVDYVLMEQVFTNLISNSIKYSPQNSLIQLSARLTDGDQLLVEVSNQGPPVPIEELARIFDKFHRITATERVTGTGLGLSICKGIIEAHGGHIWAKNIGDGQQPKGMAFLFTLPLSDSAGKPLTPPAETPESSHCL